MENLVEVLEDVLLKNGFVLKRKGKCSTEYSFKAQENITCEISEDEIVLFCYANGYSFSDMTYLPNYDEDICPVCLLEQKLPEFIKRAYIILADSIIIDAFYNAMKLLDKGDE